MAELPRSKRLKKSLTLLDVYAIGTGTTLSAGFFLLPGIAFAKAGPGMVFAYLLAAVPLIPAMLCAMELATAMPRAGGAYYFLDRSIGPLAGTVGGFGTWLVLILKSAFALIGMGAYLKIFFPEVQIIPLAIGLGIFFCVVNLFGARMSGSFQIVFVFGLLAILGWFCGTGLFHIRPELFENPFGKGFDSVMATAGLVYISYIGVTNIASISEEVKDPERNLPLGVFLALGTAILVYALGTIVMVGVTPASRLAGSFTPVAEAAGAMVGRWGVILVTISAILAFSSVAKACLREWSASAAGWPGPSRRPSSWANLSVMFPGCTWISVAPALLIRTAASWSRGLPACLWPPWFTWPWIWPPGAAASFKYHRTIDGDGKIKYRGLQLGKMTFGFIYSWT